MANRLADLADDDILYVLTTEDIAAVGEELEIAGIDEHVSDPEFVRSVKRGVEAGMGSGWHDVMETAISEAVDIGG